MQRQLPGMGAEVIRSRGTIGLGGVFLFVAISLSACQAFALGEKSHVTTAPETSSFALVQKQAPARVFVDPADWPGVLHAATNLISDVQQVTRKSPELIQAISGKDQDIVLIGTQRLQRVRRGSESLGLVALQLQCFAQRARMNRVIVDDQKASQIPDGHRRRLRRGCEAWKAVKGGSVRGISFNRPL